MAGWLGGLFFRGLFFRGLPARRLLGYTVAACPA